jgi:Holliday junction DNA helicase RuvB
MSDKSKNILIDRSKNRFNFNLRPRSLSEYVGNDNIKRIIRIAVAATKKPPFIPFGHVLIMGPYGHGKTALAELICKEFNAKPNIIGAGNLKTITDLNTLMLFGIPEDDYGFIIIDEIHNIDDSISDLLHSAMDNFTYSYSDSGHNIINIDTKRFTLIGCTTREGKLSQPFRSRFRKPFYLEPYTPLQIRSMVLAAAKNNNISIDGDAAYEIAIRSQNIPRTAIDINLLNCYEFALQTDGIITPEIVTDCMGLHQIDDRGLTQQQRLIIKTLNSKPMGLHNIAGRTGMDILSILDYYEPYLIKIGLVEKDGRGRFLTDAGKKYKDSLV